MPGPIRPNQSDQKPHQQVYEWILFLFVLSGLFSFTRHLEVVAAAEAVLAVAAAAEAVLVAAVAAAAAEAALVVAAEVALVVAAGVAAVAVPVVAAAVACQVAAHVACPPCQICRANLAARSSRI